jgi:hypothetical protein
MTDEDAARWAKREGAEIEQVPNSGEVRTAVTGYGAVFFPALIATDSSSGSA